MNWTKLLFAISAVICLPLYGFLSFTRFDAQTGFLRAGTLTTVFYAALAVLAVLMLAGSFLQKAAALFHLQFPPAGGAGDGAGRRAGFVRRL